MDRCAAAYAYHKQGYNCAQSVAGAFADLTGTAPEQLMAAMGGFGGGVGGSHEELCGAVSGGVLVLSLLHPHTDGEDRAGKVRLYAQAKEFRRRFQEVFGLTRCGDLLRARPGVTERNPASRHRPLRQHDRHGCGDPGADAAGGARMTLYSEAARPTLEEIDAYAHTPLWPQLRAYLAAAYGAGPRLEYSRCGLEPGWNVKFRRGSKSLCTVYLRPGFVTAMVSVAPKDEEAAQMVLLTCTAETQAVYHRSAASKMGRWLMLDITSPEMLEDVKALLAVRVKPAE